MLLPDYKSGYMKLDYHFYNTVLLTYEREKAVFYK